MNNKPYLALVGGLAFWMATMAPSAYAQQSDVQLGVEAGIRATDNIKRSPDTATDPAIDESVYQAGADFSVLRQTSRLSIDAEGSVSRRSYENSTFSDETLARLDASLSLQLIEEMLHWDLQANHGQQVVDPFQAVSPDNREDITIISTGPRLRVAIGNRTSIDANVNFTNMTYEVRPFDNQRVSGALSFMRAVTENGTVSLNVNSSRLEYDNSQISAPIETYQAFFGIDSGNHRNELGLKLGWNQFEQAGAEGDGLLVDLSFSRLISPQARLSVSAGSKYVTNGDVFTRLQGLNDHSAGAAAVLTDAADVQGANDAFQNDYATIAYSLTKTRTTFSVRANWSEEDYEFTNAFDRTSYGARASVRREVSRTLTLSGFASYSKRDYSNVIRNDDDTSYGVAVSKKIGSKFTLDVSVSGYDRSSDLADNSYDELRGVLTLRYAIVGEQ